MSETPPPYSLRLQEFVNSLKLTSSQVADYIGIPRPSFSQLLSGRNKTIASSTLEMIHNAYPTLNLNWLLFGEGNMLEDANFEISRPQNSPNPSLNIGEISGNKEYTSPLPENISNDGVSENRNIGEKNVPAPKKEADSETREEQPLANDYQVSYVASKTHPHITRIVVIYSDGNCSTFVPEK